MVKISKQICASNEQIRQFVATSIEWFWFMMLNGKPSSCLTNEIPRPSQSKFIYQLYCCAFLFSTLLMVFAGFPVFISIVNTKNPYLGLGNPLF